MDISSWCEVSEILDGLCPKCGLKIWGLLLGNEVFDISEVLSQGLNLRFFFLVRDVVPGLKAKKYEVLCLKV